MIDPAPTPSAPPACVIQGNLQIVEAPREPSPYAVAVT